MKYSLELDQKMLPTPHRNRNSVYVCLNKSNSTTSISLLYCLQFLWRKINVNKQKSHFTRIYTCMLYVQVILNYKFKVDRRMYDRYTIRHERRSSN